MDPAPSLSSHLMSFTLALLPSELLLEIFEYLDHRGLINVRRTCKMLYTATNIRQFWSGLAHDLCSKSDVGRLEYQLGGFSTVELIQWTLRRSRTRDRWASGDPSQPLPFRSRPIEGSWYLNGAELLRGGRWLFTACYDGTTYIQDLDQDDPKPQFLFKVYEPLTEFLIWIDESNPELSFLVAMYSFATYGKENNRIWVHQIDCVGQTSTPSLKRVTVIPDYPRTGLRSSVALSDKFFSQCFMLWGLGGEGAITNPNEQVLQLRRYSRDSPEIAEHFVEKRFKRTPTANVFFLPGDRLGFATSHFIDTYAVSSDVSVPPRLTMLHHLPILQTVNLISTPFVGSKCTYLVGACKGTFRRITIYHDRNVPPTVQELGNFTPLKDVPAGVKFGPSASAIYQSIRPLEIFTYEHRVDGVYFQRKYYKIPKKLSYIISSLAAFDDSVGRIIFETKTKGRELVVLDLI